MRAMRSFLQALIELGKTIGQILVTLVTRPLSLLDSVVAALLQLGRAFAQIVTEAVNAGLDLVKEIVRAAVKAGQALVEFTKFIVNAELIEQIEDGFGFLCTQRLQINLHRV